MGEGEQRDDAQPRVVKKVVKKSVARPAAPSQNTVAPSQNTAGTPGTTAPTAKSAPRPAPRPAPRASAVSRLNRADQKKAAAARGVDTSRPRGPRTTIDLGAKLGSARGRMSDAAHGGADLGRRGFDATRDRTVDAFWAVRDWRVPEIAPVAAGAITGLLAGLFVVAACGGLLELFTALRGTSSGGALWGGLAVLLVAAVAAEGATRLLTAFGVESARPSVTLTLMVVAVVVMLAFLEPVDGPWAWLIVPGLCTAFLPVVNRLVVRAAAVPTEG